MKTQINTLINGSSNTLRNINAAKQEARKYVGECIRMAREGKGLSLRQVEKLTGIAYNHIGRIERGKYNVTIDTLAVIANALGVRITFTDIEDS